MITNGKATYPVIGVSVEMNYRGEGALIAKTGIAIVKGGAADKAGLMAGDVIIEFGGRAIGSAEELIVAIRAQSVGDKVEIIYKRGSVSKSATLVLTASE